MELKEGMYIRTKEGIRKIIDIYEDEDGKCYELNKSLHYNYPEGHDLFEKDLQDEEDPIEIKASFNIIDLIEVGDILEINEFKNVYTIYKVELFRNPYTNEKYLGVRDFVNFKPKRLGEIPTINLSIVTHEQFDAMKYEVK